MAEKNEKYALRFAVQCLSLKHQPFFGQKSEAGVEDHPLALRVREELPCRI
ncbi:MAG: hypothetical protein LBS36_00935 [Oscillospiraceae bacterium]|nr:hypothetical protein [Oscillospiraceae bacterium]